MVNQRLPFRNRQYKNLSMTTNAHSFLLQLLDIYEEYERLCQTKAFYYGNFKLYIKNMVSKWLRELIPLNDMVNDFDISYDFLAENNDLDSIKAEFQMKLRALIKERWWIIVDNIAKKLTYDCLQPDLNNCFHYYSWDTGFRNSLKLINNKFSSVDFWHDNLFSTC